MGHNDKRALKWSVAVNADFGVVDVTWLTGTTGLAREEQFMVRGGAAARTGR